MRVKPIRISNLICASPYGFTGIQSRSSVVGDDDVPDYDDTSSGDIWDAN